MNVDSNHVARAHTLATLLESQTTVQSAQLVVRSDVPIESEGFVEDEFFELISWLTILDSDGDTISCGQRDDLAAIKRMMQSAAGFESEGTKSYHNTSSQFTRSKAQIVLDACKRFGGTVLDQDKLVAFRTLSERDRIRH